MVMVEILTMIRFMRLVTRFDYLLGSDVTRVAFAILLTCLPLGLSHSSWTKFYS